MTADSLESTEAAASIVGGMFEIRFKAHDKPSSVVVSEGGTTTKGKNVSRLKRRADATRLHRNTIGA